MADTEAALEHGSVGMFRVCSTRECRVYDMTFLVMTRDDSSIIS